MCPSKTSPCVHSKCNRVYRHHAHMLKHMCAWCQYLRGRFERAHGDVLDGHTTPPQHHDNTQPPTTPQPHRQHRPHTTQHSSPKFAHVGLSRASEVHHRNPWILHILSLKIDREQHDADSSNRSLYLIKLFNSSSPEGPVQSCVTGGPRSDSDVKFNFRQAERHMPGMFNCKVTEFIE